MDLEIGDFIKVLKEPEYDFCNNVYTDSEEGLPVFKVHQASIDFRKNVYRLALEEITKPGHIDYHVVPVSRIKVLPTTHGEPYNSILKGNR